MANTKSAKEKPISEYIEILRNELPDLKESHKIESLSVFGSYIHDDQTEGSDLDLLVEFEETPTLFQFIRLENHLTETLCVKVDLVMKDALKPRIKKRVLEEAQQV